MALKLCRECNREVSTEAELCPQCGVKDPTKSKLPLGRIFLIILAILDLLIIINDPGSSPPPTVTNTQPIAQKPPPYQSMDIKDFFLDFRQLPKGTRVEVTGYYERVGNSEFLVADPYPFGNGSMSIIINTDNVDRNMRKKIFECISQTTMGGCRGTFRGNNECSSTRFGRDSDDPCLIVEEISAPPSPHVDVQKPVPTFTMPTQVMP